MTPNGSDDGVLDPEDLVLDEERVDRLEENRFVVRPDDANADRSRPRSDLPLAARDLDSADDPAVRDASAASTARADPTAGAADHAKALEASPDPHGVDVTLKTDGEITHHRGTSHDVREVFVDLLTWYAGQLDDDTSPREALQVMLATSDLEV